MKVAAWCQILALVLVPVPTRQQRYNCSTGGCVNRKQFLIRAILHGDKTDPFWQQVQASMIQTARDLKVHFNLTCYDIFDSQTMASDIEQSVFSNPDALIVTLPDSSIQRAVGNVISSTSIPVFGLNTGYDIASSLNVKSFIAMDDNLAGSLAGDAFREALLKVDGKLLNESGLFVNSEAGNLAVETRMFALQDSLPELYIESYSFDPGTSQTDISSQLTAKFTGCPYRIVQLSSALPLQAATAALEANGCSKTLVGAVDTNDAVYAAIREGKVLFTISQQAHLQGSFPVLMATLFATTGQALAPAGISEDGNYLSGPVVVNASTMPSDLLQQCQSDAFPICPHSLNAVGQAASCPCTNRKQIHLAGVTHGVTTDSFWDLVYAAMDQAAIDFDVNLKTVRLQPEDNDNLVQSKLSDQIRGFCKQDIDGLFVSIPSQVVIDALTDCLAFNIPIVSINSGAEAAQALGLLEHIGQLEYRAGEGAGQRMIDKGVRYGYCLMHETDNSGLIERCAGMKGAFDASEVDGVQFMGSLDVPKDNVAEYKSTVENAVNVSDSSWDGVGVLLCGQIQVPGILAVKRDHSNLKIGSFDSSPALFEALHNGTILFGIDQNSYLQGYLPVALLTMYSYTKQDLVDFFVESGPDFIEAVPTAEKQECEADLFSACFDNSTDLHGGGTSLSSSPLSAGAIAGLSVACAFVLFSFLFACHRNRVLSSYVNELQQQGKHVPTINIARRLECTFKPVKVVMENAQGRTFGAIAATNGQPVAAVEEAKIDDAM